MGFNVVIHFQSFPRFLAKKVFSILFIRTKNLKTVCTVYAQVTFNWPTFLPIKTQENINRD